MSQEHTSRDNEDIELMLRVKNGDMDAFEQLVQRHQQHVINTVMRMLGSPHDAEDVAQEVFVRIYKAAPKYEPHSKFTTWLFTIVKNVTYNEIRRRQARIKTDSSPPQGKEDDQPEIETKPDTAHNPEQNILHKELEHQLEKALASLPEQQRLALVLLRYEEMSYEDIAKVLKVSLGALKSIIFRARESLKQKLSKYL